MISYFNQPAISIAVFVSQSYRFVNSAVSHDSISRKADTSYLDAPKIHFNIYISSDIQYFGRVISV